MRVVIAVLLAACGHDTLATDANADAAPDATIVLPGQPHGLFVLLNQRAMQTTYARITAHVMHEATVKGATYQVQWQEVQPTPTADFSAIAQLASEWRAAGKQLNLVFETGPYTSMNTTSFVPVWYSATAAIASLAQTGTDLQITTQAAMTFFVGDPVMQWIQISGTGNVNLDGHVYPITSVTGTTLHATGDATNAGVSLATGAVGNPMYGPPCAPQPTAVPWSPNFHAAWRALMTQVKAQLDDGSIGYMRFGLGIGGENSPAIGLATACKQQLNTLGFTALATWPAVDSAAWQTDVAGMWVADQAATARLEHDLGFATPLSFSLSPIAYQPLMDASTPDRTAEAAVTAGLAIGNQGWAASDAATYAAHGHCAGDWCALFDLYAGQVPLELQSKLTSDPSGSGMTGSLVDMFPFAIARHAQILEIYADDWLCTYDANDARANACTTAGYADAFAAAAAGLD